MTLVSWLTKRGNTTLLDQRLIQDDILPAFFRGFILHVSQPKLRDLMLACLIQ